MADIVERIRRLLALSESSNVNEAAAAAAKAAELMAKHQIDQATLDAEVDAPDEPVEAEDLLALGGKAQPWKMMLASSLASANGCATYTQVRSGRQRIVTTRIVGPKRGADTVRYMLAYLQNEVERLLKADVDQQRNGWAKLGAGFNARSYAGSFRLGAACEIAKRIRESSDAVSVAARSTASAGAIVRVDRAGERLADAMAALGLEKPTTRPTYSNSSAFKAGAQAGAGVALGSGRALCAGSKGHISGGG
jgi:hypothetical protein